nr:serine/threonine protein kinase [Deltaproteobacteria bacterium]
MHIGPGTVIDRYTVESVLGEGGMAIVYKVRHNTLGSLHALKVLTITSPELKRRLVQEGRVQGQLRHPNIVQVTDVVDVGDAPALVMEFIEGPTLDDYVEKQRPTLAQVDSLAQGILDGVAAAHAKGLVHRDLKPGNILLQVSPSGLTPKITDFGLAKVQGGEPGGWMRTREGTAMGTPHYMSPEQIRDAGAVGEPGDVFALGAILYELVTGRLAFDGADILEIFNKVAEADYVPVRQLVPEVPDRMERAITGALKERIADRVQSVADLRAVWNGERLGPWDPKTLGEVVAMLPAEARSKTNFSMAPFTRYTAGTLMGGGVLFALLAVLGAGLALTVALGIGIWQMAPSDANADATVAEAGAVGGPAVAPDDLPFVGPVPV